MRIRVQGPRTLKGKIVCPACKLRFVVRDAANLDTALLDAGRTREPARRSTHAARDAIDTFRDRVRQAADQQPAAPTSPRAPGGYAPRPRPLLEGIDRTIPETGPPAAMRAERVPTTAMPPAQQLRGRREVDPSRTRHDAASVLKGLTRSERAPTRPPTRDVPLDPFPQSHGQTRDLGRYLADSAVFELASVDDESGGGRARRLQDMHDDEPDFVSDIQPIASPQRDAARTEVARALSDDLAATRPDPAELVTTETALESDLLAALDPDALMRGEADDLLGLDDDDEHAATRQFTSVEAMLEHGARLAARERAAHRADPPTDPANPIVDDYIDLDDDDGLDAIGAETRTYGRDALDRIREGMFPSGDAPTPPAPRTPDMPTADAPAVQALRPRGKRPRATAAATADAAPDASLVAASRRTSAAPPSEAPAPPRSAAAAVTVGDTAPPPTDSDIVDISAVGEALAGEPSTTPEPAAPRAKSTSDWSIGAAVPEDELPRRGRAPRPIERSSGRVLPWLVLILILIIVGGLVWWLVVGNAQSAPPVESAPAAELPPGTPDGPTPAAIGAARQGISDATALAAAMAGARGRVAEALDPVAMAHAQFDAARAARDAGDLEAAVLALELLDQLPGGVLSDVEHALLFAELLIDTNRHPRAREVLWRAREAFVRDSRVTDLLTRAIDEDRWLMPRVDTLGHGDIDGVKALGGGSTLTFKFVRDGKTVAAFKPEQTRRQSDYRAEIASWRLCRLLRCAFDIPYNRPVKLSRQTFDALYGRYTSSKQLEYKIGFPDLIWREEGGQSWLYGTEKAWVPSFTQFPIEVTSVWDPWLSQSEPLDELDVPLDDALRPWQSSEFTQKHYTRVRELAGDLTTRGLAHQISDMLVFDYLVTNWDRFSGVKDWWGTNCQFGDGHLISIDNGAAFAVGRNSKVKRRFMRAERFSRSLILELRLLERDATLERLFPNPTRRERERFELFWKKRTEVLGRIDALIQEHGEDAVLVFE